MPLPPELLDIPEDTAVVGDVDAFLEYVESGEASKHYTERLARRIRELDAALEGVRDDRVQ